MLPRSEILRFRKEAGNSRETRARMRAAKAESLRRKHTEKFVEPPEFLEMANENGLQEAFEHNGKLHLKQRDNDYVLELTNNYRRSPSHLVMPFIANDTLFSVRFRYVMPFNRRPALIIEKAREPVGDFDFPQYVMADYRDMGHIDISAFERLNIAVPLLKIARNHALVDAQRKGNIRNGKPHVDASIRLGKYVELFQRAGYRIVGERELTEDEVKYGKEQDEGFRKAGTLEKYKPLDKVVELEYSGVPDPTDDLNNYYNVWVIDSKTGKLKPVKAKILNRFI